MPCTDVTEVLTLTLDHDDRVAAYSLTKLTCGGSVYGRSMISRWVKRQTAENVLAITTDRLLDEAKLTDPVEEYLHLKHLFSIQAALAALLGRESGRPDDFCVVNTVTYTDKGTELIAELNIDVITDEIKACGRCNSCGSKSASG